MSSLVRDIITLERTYTTGAVHIKPLCNVVDMCMTCTSRYSCDWAHDPASQHCDCSLSYWRLPAAQVVSWYVLHFYRNRRKLLLHQNINNCCEMKWYFRCGSLVLSLRKWLSLRRDVRVLTTSIPRQSFTHSFRISTAPATSCECNSLRLRISFLTIVTSCAAVVACSAAWATVLRNTELDRESARRWVVQRS